MLDRAEDAKADAVTTPTSVLTPRQLEILQHSLGVDQFGQGRMYRNHFCAGGSDVAICQSLIELGYMQRHCTTDLFPGFNCSVTDSGKEAVRQESPAPPRLTRSQQRYQRFLKADTGCSFREWLKSERSLEEGEVEHGPEPN